MKILVIIAFISFAALAGAAFAIVRHIRKNAAEAALAPSDATLDQALASRLSNLTRNASPVPPAVAAVTPPANAEHDFSYFNKELPETPVPEEPFPEMHDPEATERPRTTAADHL